MMSTSTRLHGSPFTASQWQELEHQALIFKYMVSGMPIPSDLIFSIKTTNMLMDSSSSSSSTRLFPHQPIGGRGYFEMGMGFGRIRKADPEPGRCRRTDGKKWRCSKEAYTDSKYCEKHMHRGRNRSRKPVEITPTPPTPSNIPSNSSLKPHGFDFSFQTSSNTDLALDSGSYSLLAHNKDCRNKYFYGLKEEEEMETSRTLRGLPNSSFDQSQSLTDRFKDDRNRQREQQQYWFGLGSDFKSQRTVNRGGEEETQKPLRHFLSISMPISSPEFPDSNSRTPD